MAKAKSWSHVWFITRTPTLSSCLAYLDHLGEGQMIWLCEQTSCSSCEMASVQVVKTSAAPPWTIELIESVMYPIQPQPLPHTFLTPFLSSSQGQVCTKCGSILSSLLDKPAAEVAAAAAHKERKWTCKTCDSGENIQLLAFPYVFRYLVAELAGMNIKVSLDVKKVGSG